MEQTIRRAQCTCGTVQFVATGAPIVTAICYCSDCQAGGRMIEALPGAAPVCDADGGTHYLTYRRDRWQCVTGENLLQPHKNRPEAPTARFVASCCQSAMFLSFAPGFWVSTYRNRYVDPVPPLQFRNQIRDRTATSPLPDDAPAYRRFPPMLFVRLLAARVAMWFGR